MLKKILFTLVIIPAFNLSAQLNTGFEQWTNKGTYEDPDNWGTLNITSILGDSLSVLKSPTAYTGKYSALIRSTISALFSDTVPGIMVQTLPYTSKPNSLRVAYQHSNANGTDSALVSVEFYNGATSDPNNLIGYADLYLPKNTNWQFAQQDITWDGLGNPDTMIITVFSGSELSSQVKIDDIELSAYSASAPKVVAGDDHLFLAPNGDLIIRGMDVDVMNVSLYNSRGQIVYSGISKQNSTLHTESLSSGVYFYRIESAQKGEVFSGKVLKR